MQRFIFQVTTQNNTRCMSLRYFIWFYIEYTGILNGISMRWNVSCGKQKRRLYILYIYTGELWSLELACLEHQGLLELVRRSRQFPYIFNVKIHPRLEQWWLELSNSKHGPQGDFSCKNAMMARTKYFFTWISHTLDLSLLLFPYALCDNDDFTLGLPNWRAERVKQLAAIYQIKDLSKFSLVTT